MMELVHYSKQRFAGPVRSNPASKQKADWKPAGFWVSVEGFGDTWRDWCEQEEFQLDGLACRAKIILAPNARILWLGTVDDIDVFTESYCASMEFLPGTGMIDWPRVAGRWQGIIIAPYQWERRLSHLSQWYYVWDCASGCIWDAAAIAEIRALENTE